MKFRLINTGFNTPSMNMAIDEALLFSKLPVLRFYQWKPAGLSLGYFQSVRTINSDFCSDNGIEIVRRVTGGNAVLHDSELTYSFIVNETLMPSSVLDSYREISKGILSALHSLGLNAAMNESVDKNEKSAVCFNDPSWYEIIVNGKKIVGSAQKRIDGKLLQHGAVLIDVDVKKYANCFSKCDGALIMKLNERMTSINKELGKKITSEDVAFAMKKGFEKELNIEFFEDTLTSDELGHAQQLNNEKYSSQKWNFMR